MMDENRNWGRGQQDDTTCYSSMFRGLGLWIFMYQSRLQVQIQDWKVHVHRTISNSACEQNSSRTDEPIWTRFSLNGCLPH